MKHKVAGSKTQDIGKNIKTHREKLGITQLQLAERINSDQGFISKLEAGRNTTINVLGRVSGALNVDIVELLK